MNSHTRSHSFGALALAALGSLAASPAGALAQAEKVDPLVEERAAEPPAKRALEGVREVEATKRRAAEKRPAPSPSPSPAAVKLAQAPGAPDDDSALPGRPQQCRPPKGKFMFNADKEDIQSLLKRISQITCKNFIVAETVKGKSDITIISHQPVTAFEAEAAFLAALEANNMALVPAGRYWKVVERKDSVKADLPLYESTEDLPHTDAQVTLLYEIKYADASAAQQLLRNLMSKSGDLQLVGGNLIILTDAASNIHRLTRILQKIDVAGSSSRLHVVKIVWADAQSVAQKLQEIFKDASPKGGGKSPARARPRVAATPEGGEAPATTATNGEEGEGAEDLSIDKIIADERTNKLIILASQKAFLSLKDVIDLLDVPDTDTSTGTSIFVHPLNNTDATKAASTLSSLAQGGAKKPAKGAAPKSGPQSAELFEGEVKVTADETTNSLVIVASPRDYKALRRVVEQLDARRPQVFVEAAIMEIGTVETRRVSLDAYTGLPVTVPGLEGTGLGIIANEGGQNLVVSSAQALAARSLFERVNNIDPTQLGAAVDASTALESLLGVVALQGPAVPGSEDIFGFPVPSFGVVLNALQTNANVNVLSTPHIMTTDNEKAEISVGERVPVVRGISPVGGGQGGFFGGLQQVAYEDVKLKFTVTPHVNDAGEIRVELEQEVSDLGGSVPVGGGLNQPIITSRMAKTTVVVKDQQTVVLGGLMADRENDSESKIPILGDVPIIGWLFKNWSDGKNKTNLILVLTPYIIRNEEDFRKIYERKLRERKEFLETYYGIASDYNPYIDYTKKTGPVGELVERVDYELMKVENGGPGLPGDILITPEAQITPLSFGAGRGGAEAGADELPDDAEEPTGDEPPAPEGEGALEPPPPAPPPEAAPAPAPEGGGGAEGVQ